MTQTLEAQADLTPQQRVDTWLADFEAALAARDIDRVVGKFATDSGLWERVADQIDPRLQKASLKQSR